MVKKIKVLFILSIVILLSGCVSHEAPEGKTVLNPNITSNQSSNESTQEEGVNLTGPNLDFQSFFGSGSEEVAYSIIEAEEGYLLAGYMIEDTHERAYIVKSDEEGSMEWDKSFIFGEEKESSEFWDAVNTGDGYLLIGDVWVNDTNVNDFLIVKVDSGGGKEWSVNYGGDVSQENARGVARSSDDGFVITGYTNGHGAGEEIWETIIYVIKLDSNGDLIWSKSYNPTHYSSVAWDITCTSDDGFVITGDVLYYYGEDSGYDAYVMKIDSEGNLLWDYAYDSGGSETGTSVIESNDGGLVVVGDSQRDVIMFKLNSTGGLSWSTIVDDDYSDKAWGVVEESDGYVLTGYSSKSVGDDDAFLFKIDKQGEIIWKSFYGGNSSDTGYDMIKHDDAYVFTGRTASNGSGGYDFWLAGTE